MDSHWRNRLIKRECFAASTIPSDPTLASDFGNADEPDPNLIADPSIPRKVYLASNANFNPSPRRLRPAKAAAQLLAMVNCRRKDEDATQRDKTQKQNGALPRRPPAVDHSETLVALEKRRILSNST